MKYPLLLCTLMISFAYAEDISTNFFSEFNSQNKILEKKANNTQENNIDVSTINGKIASALLSQKELINKVNNAKTSQTPTTPKAIEVTNVEAKNIPVISSPPVPVTVSQAINNVAENIENKPTLRVYGDNTQNIKLQNDGTLRLPNGTIITPTYTRSNFR